MDMAERPSLDALEIKIFADGADIPGILEMAAKPYIQGFTTNPTLMRKAGVTDYKTFAIEVLKAIPDRPVSFEVLADDLDEMERQAIEIASWGSNVNVKIPITTTGGESSATLVGRLSARGVTVNVTAMFTLDQVREILAVLAPDAPAILSIFAGRIADTARDPIPLMKEAVQLASSHAKVDILWASPRELLNIFQADDAGCHIITVTNDTLNKLVTVGKDLERFSRETVEMFRRDAVAAGFTIQTPTALADASGS